MPPADPTTCPDDAQLAAFHAGDLPAAEVDRVAAHLETCPRCEARVERLERAGDPYATALRAGRPTATLDPASPADPVSFLPPVDSADGGVGTLVGGRYKLLEVIGKGGMGVVYRAKQVEPVRRLVAVKLILEGMDTHQVLARFEAERQALALMDHPNIARVFDAGASSTGRPYFVMELVRGVPITTYCDEHRLDTRARLGLFIAACRAIQYAHQKGIIHRDIKPTNILVARYDGRPEVKVIDFGIVKAVGQPLTKQTLVTSFGAVVGTLEYMSPEQAELNQADIDTRSDVYALGVLLYELLTGSTPLERARISRAAMFEALRLVREEEPPRPSTRLSSSDSLPSIAVQRGVEPARLAPLIRGDLDWIAMKALEKDRTRRYETANGLARDVERYLLDEPVEASPPTARYRLGKFARRHRGPLRLALAGTCLLLAATAVSTWQAVRASRAEAREHAELERSEARYALARSAIETFYTGASEDVLLREPQMKELRGKLLGAALEFYRRLQAQVERGGGPAPGAATRAELAAGYEQVAALTADVGDRREALAGYARARPLRQALADADPGAAGPRRALAALDRAVGGVVLDAGTPVESAEAHRRAAAGFEAAAGLEGGGDDDRLQAASERVAAADALARTDQAEPALAALDGAVADLRRLAKARPGALGPRRALAAALAKAGYLRLNALPRPLEAIPLVDESNELYERIIAEHDATLPPREWITLRREWSDGLHHAAMGREQVGPIEDAIPRFARAFEALEPVAGRYPTLSGVRRSMADARIGIGVILAEIPGRVRESLGEYDRAAALLGPIAAENPDIPAFRARLAAAVSSRAYTLDRLGEYDAAVGAYERAIDLRERLACEQPTVVFYRSILAEDRGHLGDVQEHAGRPVAALAQYRRAIADLSDLPGANVITRLNLASWLSAAATLLDHDPAPPVGYRTETDRRALRARALGLLREVAAAGFRDSAELQRDANFAPLRADPAFRAIMNDMAFPDRPFGP